MFLRPPTTEAQRNRWLALCDAVDHETLTTHQEIRDALARRGVDAGSNHTLIDALEACHIDRFFGVYTRLPISDQEELEMVARSRLQLAAEAIFQGPGGIVTIRANSGAGEWIGSSLRVLTSPEILSVLADSSTVWVMAPEGKSADLEAKLVEWWRRGPTQGIHPRSDG